MYRGRSVSAAVSLICRRHSRGSEPAGRSARLLPLKSAELGLDELADVCHDRGGGTRLRDLELRVFVLERGVLGRTAARRLATAEHTGSGERRGWRTGLRTTSAKDSSVDINPVLS